MQRPPIASNTDVNDRAKICLRWAFNFEKVSSIGFSSGEYDGRYRNQQPCVLSAALAFLLQSVTWQTTITVVPGEISGIRTFCMYAAKAGSSMSLLIIQGAVKGVNSQTCDQGLGPSTTNGIVIVQNSWST